ncbi:uncharacterized protein LOC127564983 [Drosophila albomicans]|uniref:Uncharacterized protein LOC127564983 n=2 Tax=immigrans group TaxID=32304 RepID=A0A6P8WHK5_DROAB|nr:uncharacterized protein LOC127564983 [Drosophila albomicans]
MTTVSQAIFWKSSEPKQKHPNFTRISATKQKFTIYAQSKMSEAKNLMTTFGILAVLLFFLWIIYAVL